MVDGSSRERAKYLIFFKIRYTDSLRTQFEAGYLVPNILHFIYDKFSFLIYRPFLSVCIRISFYVLTAAARVSLSSV